MTASKSSNSSNTNSVARLPAKIRDFAIERLFSRFDTNLTALKFNANSEDWILEPSSGWKPFCIVARPFYSEFHQDFPITALKDVRIVLSQKYPQHCLHIIGNFEHGQRRVTTYQFHTNFQQGLVPPVFLVPESFVLANGIKPENFSALVSHEEPWFLARGPKGVVSSLPNKMLSTIEIFQFANGLPADAETFEITNVQLPSHLVKGIFNTRVKDLFGFFKGADFSRYLPKWQVVVGFITVTILAHMLISTLLIQWQLNDRKETIDSLGPDVQRLLGQQEKYQQLNSQLELINNHTSQVQGSVSFWSLRQLLIENAISIVSMTQQQKYIDFHGKAARATDVLGLVQKQAWCKEVTFTAPTRKVDSSEHFQLRIELHAEATYE